MKTIIGITGPIGAGKDVLGEYISKRCGMPKIEISSRAKEIALERGIPLVRQHLAKLGTAIAQEFGPAYLAEKALEKVDERAVITGIRQLAQIEYLRRHTILILISVDADPSLRFERVKNRSGVEETTTLQGFIMNEQEENGGNNVQRVFDCMQLADFSLKNEGTFQELHAEADKILKTISFNPTSLSRYLP